MRTYQLALLLSSLAGLFSCGDKNGGGATMCEAGEHGVSTSLADNTAVFQAALLSCKGRTMHVPAGTYRFSPALAYTDAGGVGNGIMIPDGTSILGDGPGNTILQVSGTGNYASFFWILDAGKLFIRNLTLVGNNARNPPPPPGAPDCYFDYGHAIFIQSVDRPIGNISISGTEFISFTGTSWIGILAGDGGKGIGTVDGPILIEGNYFKSIPGNAVAPDYIVCSASAIAIQGLGPIASAANVTVSQNTFDADYIKSGVAIWSGATHITIASNTISRAGQGLPIPHNFSNGTYAILIYQQHAVPPDISVYVRPTDIMVTDNEIVSPYSGGIYIAGGQNVSIVGNTISGQVDTYDATEPRGAIALNDLNNNFDGMQAAVSNNHITDSAIGISIAAGALPIVDSNVVESIPTRGIGIKVNGTKIDGAMLTLTNTIVGAADTAANVSSLVGFFPLRGLTIDGLYQAGATIPLRWYTDLVGTPQQPKTEYCRFSAFGSVKGVFVSSSLCPAAGDCWIPQAGYWPDYGAGCPTGE
jgi:hypothetical protein